MTTPAPNPDTLRAHLEQQIAELDYWLNGDQTTFGNLGLLRILREHAVAALAILDAAAEYTDGVHGKRSLLIPDPPVPPPAAEPKEHNDG